MTRILLAAFAVALASAADGLAVGRTFVSITGIDTNTCSQTSPCRTFAGALVKTNTGGEIIALDSGIYGNIQIDKSVTLVAAPGVHAAVGDDLKVGTPVTVTAPANARVVLRNLYITARPLPQMARGIDFFTGGTLHIENCVIAGFKDVGIRFNIDLAYCDGGVCPKLFLKDSFVRGNGVGIAARSAFATIEHSRVEDNATGIQIGSVTKATIRDSIVAANSDDGISVDYVSTVRVESCSVTENGTGLKVDSDSVSPGTLYVSDTIISGNNTGLKLVQQSGEVEGKIYSFGNNRLFGNSTDGEFSTTVQLH